MNANFTVLLRFGIFLVALGWGAASDAAPPANDLFANRTNLGTAVEVTSTSTMAEATYETWERPAGSPGGSVWWQWTAPADGNLKLVVTHSPPTSGLVLQKWHGTAAGALKPAGGFTLSSSLPHSENISVTAGQVWQMQLYHATGAVAALSLDLKFSQRPPNDHFAKAADLGQALMGSAQGSNEGASLEAGEAYLTGGSASVWWKWNAPGDLGVQVNTVGSNFDTLLGVFRGTAVGGLTLVGSHDDIVPSWVASQSNLQSAVNFRAEAGGTYFFAILGKRGATGNVALNFAMHSRPANDDWENAFALDQNSPTRGSNTGATPQLGIDALLPGGGSVWWKWRSSTDQDIVVDTKHSFFNTALSVLEKNAAGGLVLKASNDDGETLLPQSRVYFRASAGVDYWLAVTGMAGETGEARLRLFPGTRPAPGMPFTMLEKKESAEEIRWYLNRARFAPPLENVERGTNYPVAAGPLAPVAPHASLTTAAEKHSEDMARVGYFDHITAAGSLFYAVNDSPSDRVRKESYGANAAENIAAGYYPGEDTHVGWWSSTGHRNNMLGNHIECGIGVFSYPASELRFYETQVFGSRSAAPRYFTCTLFHDLDQSGTFTANEGVEGIRVELEVGGQLKQSSLNDLSGSFALPLTGIYVNTIVSIWLVNPGPEARRLSIPTGYHGMRTMGLAGGMRRLAGTFNTGAALANLGWRSVTAATPPSLNGSLSITHDPGGNRLRFLVPISGQASASLQSSRDLKGWIDVETKAAAAPQVEFDHTLPPESGSNRFFRIKLE